MPVVQVSIKKNKYRFNGRGERGQVGGGSFQKSKVEVIDKDFST